MRNKDKILSVNFHLTKACNMKCKYCFAGFNEVHEQLKFEEQKKVIRLLSDEGFTKINFVGGEPFLIKSFIELIKYAKSMGFYTSVVTNGSFITKEFLKNVDGSLDMIGISIDSLSPNGNQLIGRVSNNLIPDLNFYKLICSEINKLGIALKINTVVSRYNLDENFSRFINEINLIRWKVFQVLQVDGENNIERSKISTKEFEGFMNRHQDTIVKPTVESNEIMTGSYLMINPEGCFYDNAKGHYTVSQPIYEVGVEDALKEIEFDYSKYIKRDGNYYIELNNYAKAV